MSYLLEIVAGAAASLGVTYWTLSIATGVRTGRALARTAQVGTSADGEGGAKLLLDFTPPTLPAGQYSLIVHVTGEAGPLNPPTISFLIR